ncbi:MAG: hypothetical protein JWO31_1289 [Phycisphaerales bacterium]|nr:hypothetical protein [Phycisphaerales bacterium]
MERLVLDRRPAIAGRVQSLVVVPIDPFEGREFDLSHCPPRPLGLDLLSLEEADRGLGHSVVVAVADRPHGRIDSLVDQPLRERKRRVSGGFNWSSQRL